MSTIALQATVPGNWLHTLFPPKSMSTTSTPPTTPGKETLLSMRDESELLGEALQFDQTALSELYRRYEPKIYSYIYRRTGEQLLAEELTAQVFLKMLEAITNGKGWHSTFSGWLYRIAHNLIADHYRQRGRRQSVSLDDTPSLTDDGGDPVSSAERQLDTDRLRLALRHLTEDQVQVVTLRFLEEYSLREVADMLDKTEHAVKALQYRAVHNLRKFFES
ncbi:sigma-70 family RNA polymerase sigma factor [Chloroflexi bacterium TSY]|nr:sigma-70 family RNA polymerase sigma factor [Chloroflexi bacterium TSY]